LQKRTFVENCSLGIKNRLPFQLIGVVFRGKVVELGRECRIQHPEAFVPSQNAVDALLAVGRLDVR
jgi:hypothetical protein